MKKKVLVTYNMFRSGYAELVEKYDVTFPPDGVESFTYEEVLQMIPEYDALQSMFNFPVDKRLMDAGVKLKIISNYAVGYDNIDIPYATQKGIQVTNTPDPVTEPTADQAMVGCQSTYFGVRQAASDRYGEGRVIGKSGTFFVWRYDRYYRYGTYRTSVSPTGGCSRNENRLL